MAPAEFRVLILGDGNFSFSLALALMLSDEMSAAWTYLGFTSEQERPSRWRIMATSFDTRQEVIEKYPESRMILARLDVMTPAVEVRHGVNAWALPEHFSAEFPDGFHRIVWNHPVRTVTVHKYL